MAVDIPKYVEIKVYGLTYGEFLTIHGLNRGGGKPADLSKIWRSSLPETPALR